MNKKKRFYKKMLEKYTYLGLDEKTKRWFVEFHALNETSDDGLDFGQRTEKYHRRMTLEENDNLREAYYLYHLITTLFKKWRGVDLETVVKTFYRNSELLQELYGELYD